MYVQLGANGVNFCKVMEQFTEKNGTISPKDIQKFLDKSFLGEKKVQKM